MFYYRCIERPLTQRDCLTTETNVITVSNLSECMSLLLSEIDNTDIFRSLDTAIETFESSHRHIDKNDSITQREYVKQLYLDSLEKISNEPKVQEKINNSSHYHRTIKIAVESYVLYGLRNLLPAAMSASTSHNDAELNKIVKNLHELELKDLDIKYDIQTGVARGKLELSRLDGFVTVLGKIGCLKRAVRYISEGLEPISTDDLLPILIFIVVRAGLPNWIAQLSFIKQFRFSSDIINDADEVSFLVASLEAAVEHVRSGVLIKNIARMSLDKQQEETDNSIIVTLNQLFSAIQDDELDKVKKILNEKQQRSTWESKLCHPLCRCDKCEVNFTENQLAQSSWPSVNSKDDRGRTALHIASFYGHVTIVDFLLVVDANPNESDSDGLTPLHYAATRGHQNSVLLLLHANANPRALDNRGNSPLHLAVDHGHEACAKALLYFAEQMGITIDTSCPNVIGDTALHYASKWGYISIVEILLEHGANPRVANRRGQTPLTVAHSSHVYRVLDEHPGHVDNVLRVSRRCSHEWKKPKLRQNEITTTEKPHKADKLLAAINEGDVRLACYYLGLEGPHSKPGDDLPGLCHPLCLCEKCAPTDDTFDEYSRVVALGLNISNARGETALHAASANGLVDLVEILLDAGANINAWTNNEHRTPLHVACLNSTIKVIKLLLNCRTSNVNVKDYLGDTPLHLAARNGDFKIVELLLRHGADVNTRNLQGATALDEVQIIIKNDKSPQNHEAVMKILKTHIADSISI